MEKKKKFRELVNKDDYWLGMAFYFGVFSSYKRQSAVITDQLGLFAGYGIDSQPAGVYGESDHTLSAEIHALGNAGTNSKNGTIYLTHTPLYWSVLQIIHGGIKRIVFLHTKNLCDDSLEVLKQANVSAQPFTGNLNWLRDYIKILDDSGIFNQNHK